MTRTPASRASPGDAAAIEAELVALQPVIVGDRRARAAFVERFARLVYGVVGRTLGRSRQRKDADLVEEVFAGVFVALFERDARKLVQWSGRCSLASWVRLVAASVSLDALRRLRDAPALERIEGLAAEPRWEGEDAVEAIVHAEQLAEVGLAMERLSAADRELLTALYVDELAPGAVAARLGIAMGALYTRKNRALERLRGAMMSLGEGEL